MGHELVPSQENDQDFNMKSCLMYLYLEVESLSVFYSHIRSDSVQTSFNRIFVWLVACLIVVRSGCVLLSSSSFCGDPRTYIILLSDSLLPVVFHILWE